MLGYEVLCTSGATLAFMSGAVWALFPCFCALFGVFLPPICIQLPRWASQRGEQPLAVGTVGVYITFHSVFVYTRVKGWAWTCV